MTEKPTYERMRMRDVGLGPWGQRALRAVIETVFARGSDARGNDAREGRDSDEVTPPPAERVDWVIADMDDFLSRATARTYLTVILALVAVSLLAPLFVKRVGTLAGLAPSDRRQALERLEKSAVAPALLAVKALACVHYYEHPEAGREIGFTGECLVPGTTTHAQARGA